jgi:hypothetical protein
MTLKEIKLITDHEQKYDRQSYANNAGALFALTSSAKQLSCL